MANNKKNKQPKKMGRPRIEIDQETFERLGGLHVTLEEMAGWFQCSEDTIERWCNRTYGLTFADAIKNHSAKMKSSLRRKQIELALNGHATMLIWLGKQLLGQKEPEHKIEDSKAASEFKLNYKLDKE